LVLLSSIKTTGKKSPQHHEHPYRKKETPHAS
jgi:hypothetical protein